MERDHRSEIDLTSIQDLASSILHSEGFKLFSPFTDRHGSWELKFYLPSAGLHRTITIDFTKESPPSSPDPNPYTVEVWIGCEEGTRFLRQKVSQINTTDDRFGAPEFREAFINLLRKAVSVVTSLTADRMTATYERSRLAF